MLDKFRNLSDKGKMTVIAVAIAIFVGAIVVLGVFLGNKEKVVVPDDTTLPYATQTATPTATPTETPTATATPTTPPSPGAGISYGQTTLSVADQQDAQNIATDGIVNYFTSGKGESIESANGRLNKYFAPESGVFDKNSVNQYFNMQKTDAENYITSEASIDYIDPVGGDAKIYKVIAGLTYKVQFNRSNEMPQVLEQNGSFTILLSKDSGSWKILSIDDSKG
jgi:hypothetical protein